MARRVFTLVGALATMALVAMASSASVGSGRKRSRAGDHGLQRRLHRTPYTVPEDALGRSGSARRLEQRRHQRIPMSSGRRTSATACTRTTRNSPPAQKQIENGISNAENAVGSFRGDFARAGVPPDLAHRRSAGRPHAGVHAASREAPRPARSGHVRRTARSTRPRTSRCTTAASPAASSARCCASSTATATASCRRRAWSRSATR